MLALIPPPERRGIIFIDPPYEDKDEVKKISAHLVPAVRKWATGTFACWYPVKGLGIGRSIKGIAAEHLLPKSLSVQFLAQKRSDETLCGSGMLIVNVPWKFDALLRDLCENLAEIFGPQSSWVIEWITEPK
jgi:23S rRNA (adenine2030-N6)-methyltransferase